MKNDLDDEENKWLAYVLVYFKTDKLEKCPYCGSDGVECIISTIGRGAITFRCPQCDQFAHFDGYEERR